MGKIFFHEVQRYTQRWLWLLLITTTLLATLPFAYGIYSQEVLGIPWGNNPGSTGLLVFVLLLDSAIMSVLLVLFIKMQLIVEIRNDGIWFRYPPLLYKWKMIAKEEIDRFEIRVYNPVFEFGGWGIKGSSRNKSFTVSGKTGLQLYLKNGKKVLFGTQKNQSIIYAMDILMKREKES